MIITIIFVLMTIIGLAMYKFDKYGDYDIIGMLISTFGTIALIVCIGLIVGIHVTAPKRIQLNKIDYEGLCKRYETIKSDYEDVSKSQVIADITAWNMRVYNTKYWTENPWTNWFNPKDIADNMDYIPLE